MMSAPDDPLARAIHEHGAELVDFRFTDLIGRWSHVVHWAASLPRQIAEAGIVVASANVPGWGRLERSELRLAPDPGASWRDPFAERATLIVICETSDDDGARPAPIDSRATARRAVEHARASGLADEIRVGLEPEFYLFDDVRFHMSATECFFRVRERDSLENAGREMAAGNPGHRISYAAHHLAAPPADADARWRAELLALFERCGLEPLKHQHEAGPSQHEVTMRHAPLVVAADRLQLAKYLVHNAAQAAGRSATFMPKPLAYAPGSGLHVNLSLWRDGVPLFAREPDTLRGFIAGILAHAPALGAFTSPSTNGFKRLAALFTPGQPIGYGPGNRAAAIRLPEAASESALRLECRFPDAASNPYLVLAALTMAGLDGIRRGLDPGPPLQGDPRRVLEGFDVRRRHEPALASDLADAVITLDRDRAFLMRGEVFTSELIEAQIADLNRQIRVARSLPHPNEYYLSYGA